MKQLERRGDGGGGAGGDTLLTDDAARSGEDEARSLGVEGEGFGRTDAGAEAAMGAEVVVDRDFAAGKGDVDVLGAHPVDRSI